MADRNFQPADAEKVWIRDSDVPGPTAILLGGIHGNERAGIAVIRQMVNGKFDVPLESGKLIIALGNLGAIKINERTTESKVNLNRQFLHVPDDVAAEAADLSYEARRARELKPYLDEADASLDLHGFRQFDDVPFMITEPRGFLAAMAVSKAGARYVSSGWGGTRGIEQGGTDDYMEQSGKIGLCYELSQLRDRRRGIPRGKNGVLRFLAHLELIDPANLDSLSAAKYEPTFVQATNAVLSEEGFQWGPNFPYYSFQPLQAGELIAQNGPSASDKIFAGPGQVIIFPSDKVTDIKPGEEMFNIGTPVANPLAA